MKKIARAVIASVFFTAAFLGVSAMIPSVAVAQSSTPPDIGAQTSAPTLSFKVPNPLGENATTLTQVLANILDAIVLLLSPVIVIMLVYSGFLFVAAQGRAEELTKAKQTLMYTLIGAAIIIGAKGISLVIQNSIECLTSSTTGC